MSERPAVELQDVVKRFGDVMAVDHVSLRICVGEFFSLLGPSGCGKTTTLRLIAGFEIPTSGTVFIGGEAQGYLPPFQRPVNTVFQHYALFPHMTVFENIAFGLEMKSLPKDRIKREVDEALEMVRLGDYGNRKPKQLSGGEQQRVALARALVNHPDVLLLDEPLGALDLKLRKAMQLELKELQERVGITFIYVTHDQEEALTMSDRIAVMNLGRVLQIGTPTEIYERPTSSFVADFIGETNFLPGRIQRVEGNFATVEVSGLEPLQASAGEDCRAGVEATLAVRPEKIEIGRTRPNGSVNVLKGCVVDVVYVGTDTNYHVQLDQQVMLQIRKQNEALTLSGERLAEGDSVYLSWRPESALVIVE